MTAAIPNRRLRRICVAALFASLLTFPLRLAGQELTDEQERLLESQEENVEQSELLDLLNYRREHPLDLNKATQEELSELPGVRQSMAAAIVSYRNKRGKFSAREELLEVPGFDLALFAQIAALVKVETGAARRRMLTALSLRSRVSDKPTLHGSEQKLYNRLQFSISDRFTGGALVEKDPGEGRLDDLRLFFVQGAFGRNWQVILGNYEFMAGQGLVFWGPYGFAKSADAVFPVKKNGKGLHRYLSVDENAALFGSGVTYRAGFGQISIFASQNDLDATVTPNGEVSSISSSGLHASPSELARKDALTERLAGARLLWRPLAGGEIGFTGYATRFSKALNSPDLARKHFALRGNRNTVLGMDASFAADDFDVFGELARSRNGGLALLAGARLNWRPARLAILYRDYARDFQNLHGFAFGERNGDTQNERGYYLGLDYRIAKGTRLNAYFDVFSFPWRSFFQPLPGSGSDFLAQLEQRLSRGVDLTLRFRDKSKPDFISGAATAVRPQSQQAARRRRQFRIQLDMKVSERMSLRSRVEYALVHYERYAVSPAVPDGRGFLLYQDVRLRPFRGLSLTARLSLFGTDSFDSRVFQYEHDLPGVLSNRALFGRGSRWYALLRYKVGKWAVIHLKYASTLLDEDAGRADDRIALQMDIRL